MKYVDSNKKNEGGVPHSNMALIPQYWLGPIRVYQSHVNQSDGVFFSNEEPPPSAYIKSGGFRFIIAQLVASNGKYHQITVHQT